MIDVIYEDNHVLVVNKPAGLLTQSDSSGQKSLEELCKRYIKDKFKKPGKVFLEAIHRIDKPVSGIVIFGRTSKAVSRLKASFRDRKTTKKYIAAVEGKAPKQGTLEHHLIHDNHFAKIVTEEHPKAKLARLHFERKKILGNGALVEINLETGRYHQIRVQLASIGCPVVGDVKYGSEMSHNMDGIALHHCYFEIPHPTKGELMQFKSTPPWL